VDLYPAIDLLAGRVVQLRQGDYDRATDYGGDPAAVAATFVEQGARWLHVVDLDAARTGEPVNRAAVEAVVAAAGGARVEAGGGVGAFVVTDIGRDGTLAGPDVRGLAAVLAATDVPVVASGGVGSLDDLRALAALEAGGRRLAGAIVGTAIHDGRFTVSEALAAAAGR
jgi:phosphoribosylformimino-5-aminoimidazole carboxamide ribonucleotide (ProFAR) isomerase